jgi:hypothetical protein
MIKTADVEQLIQANERVRMALLRDPTQLKTAQSVARGAAGILCEELEALVHENSAFWEGLEDASTRLKKHRDREAEFFGNIRQLIEQEELVFAKLGIDQNRSADVIAQAYAALRIVSEYEDPSPSSLANLRNRITYAQKLVCEASKGPVRRTLDHYMGFKGARILAGAAVGGANAAVMLLDQGGLSWVSVKAGYHVMKGDVEGLMKLFEGGGVDGFDV